MRRKTRFQVTDRACSQCAERCDTGKVSFCFLTTLFHRIGSLLPQGQDEPKFAQVYVCDAELQTRAAHNKELDKEVMQDLQTMLHAVNPYVQMYKTAKERLGESPAENFCIRWFTDISGVNRRRYNAPQVSEIGVIVTDDGKKSTGERDIIVQPKHGAPKRISEFSSCYDPMHYVLLFPHGTNGWSVAFKEASCSSGERGRGVTIFQYYRYMLGVRPGVGPLMPYAGGRLCQEYITDMYCKVDRSNLQYIETHQHQIRADVYYS